MMARLQNATDALLQHLNSVLPSPMQPIELPAAFRGTHMQWRNVDGVRLEFRIAVDSARCGVDEFAGFEKIEVLQLNLPESTSEPDIELRWVAGMEWDSGWRIRTVVNGEEQDSTRLGFLYPSRHLFCQQCAQVFWRAVKRPVDVD